MWITENWTNDTECTEYPYQHWKVCSYWPSVITASVFIRSVVLHIWPWERQRLLILMCKTERTISDIFQTRMQWIVYYYYYYYYLLLNDSYDCFLGLTYATCWIGYFMSVNLWIECSSRKSTLTFRCFSTTCFCTRSVEVCALLSSCVWMYIALISLNNIFVSCTYRKKCFPW